MDLNESQKNQIEELKQFCSQPSVSAENRGMQEMVAIVEQKLLDLGAEVKKVIVKDSYPFLLAELKAKTNSENKKTVLIYNHYDVQPEDPIDLWETPPFTPTIKDGKLFVRGVSDNKANMLLRFQAIRQMLDDFNGDLPVNLKWLIEGEEEIGSIHLHDLQLEYGNFWKDADVCVWETGGVTDTGAPYLKLGMKGVLYVELFCEFNKTDIHSGDASIIDSPVWRLVHALSTIRDVNGVVTVDDIYENALGPTPQELEIIDKSLFDPLEYTQSSGGEKTLVPVTEKAKYQKQMYYTCTANICGIWGGYTKPGGIKTILPNAATAKVDFRLVPNQTTHEVLDKLRKHLDVHGYKDIKIKHLISEEFGKSKIENDFIQKCLKVMETSYGQPPVVQITTLGSGPVHFIAGVYDIPVVHFGADYPSSSAHAPNENIRISDYFDGMTCFINYLIGLNL